MEKIYTNKGLSGIFIELREKESNKDLMTVFELINFDSTGLLKCGPRDKLQQQSDYPGKYVETTQWDNFETEERAVLDNEVVAQKFSQHKRFFRRPCPGVFVALSECGVRHILYQFLCETVEAYLSNQGINYSFNVKQDTGLGKCDLALVDHDSDRPILPILVKFKDFCKADLSVMENTVEQIKSYMTSPYISFGIATNLKETRVFKKVAQSDEGVCKVQMSPAIEEKSMLSATFFAVIQSIQEYEVLKNSINDQTQDAKIAGKPNHSNDTEFKNSDTRGKFLSVYNRSYDIEYESEALVYFGKDLGNVKIEIDKSFKRIASGRCGQVFAGHVSKNDEITEVAIKICDRSDRRGKGLQDEMCNEARILRYLNACGVKCAPQLLWTGVFMYSNLFANVIQLIRNGHHESSLSNLPPHRSDLLARALNELHSVGVHHGDIRPTNVIFSNFDGEERCFVIDYGFSTLFTSARPYTELLRGDDFEVLWRSGEFENDKEFLSREELAPGVEIKLKQFLEEFWLKEVQSYRQQILAFT